MSRINILDHQTIDQIAAGEVVERPASVVKELVENSMDAGATVITVEIKKGGIEFIRVTDNGSGIDKDDMEKAFLRHATSKIACIEDLNIVRSMGFRGEALASIASVARVEVISKCEADLLGSHYEVEGGEQKLFEEIGAPNGTTIIVRNLFYNTPVRRKFLKSDTTEAIYITELMEHLALSRPDISFQFVLNNKTKFSTPGSGDLRDIIYRVYGRDYVKEIVPIDYEENGICIEGYLGTPVLNRSNRNLENYYINRRFIKSDVIAKGIEKGYQAYVMQHKFPFCVLHFSMDTAQLDVNVHPTKREVRFHDGKSFYELIVKAVQETLHSHEMIAGVHVEEDKNEVPEHQEIPEAFEVNRLKDAGIDKEIIAPSKPVEVKTNSYSTDKEKLSSSIQEVNELADKEDEEFIFDDLREENINLKNDSSQENIEIDSTNHSHDNFESKEVSPVDNSEFKLEEIEKDIDVETENNQDIDSVEEDNLRIHNKILNLMANSKPVDIHQNIIKEKDHILVQKPTQLSLFEEERVLSAKARSMYTIIGQVFDTYWLITYNDSIYFIDQHAAHEKVNYERLMKQVESGEVITQQCNPPIIVSVPGKDQITLLTNLPYFEKLGFVIEEFGGNEFAIREIPLELYFNNPKTMFLDVLEELADTSISGSPESITSRVATMACKASVKGGMKMSKQEMEVLLDEMLTLENPYHCPHGRPTMFSMSKYELEKKFKRVVD